MTDVLDPATAVTTLLHAPLGVVLIDGQRRVAWLNPAAAHLLGASRDQLLGQTPDNIAAPWREAVFAPAATLRLAPPAAPPGRWLPSCRTRWRTLPLERRAGSAQYPRSAHRPAQSPCLAAVYRSAGGAQPPGPQSPVGDPVAARQPRRARRRAWQRQRRPCAGGGDPHAQGPDAMGRHGRAFRRR